MSHEPTLGELIAKRRNARGWSVRELERKLDAAGVKITATQLSNIERNARPSKKSGQPERPSEQKLDGLADVLGMPRDELRRAAHYEIPVMEEEGLVVEIAANVREMPPDVQRIFLTHARAVRDLFAVGQQEDDGKEGNGKDKGTGDVNPPARGVKPGDPDYREPSGTLTPPPRRKKRGDKDAPSHEKKQGRRTA